MLDAVLLAVSWEALPGAASVPVGMENFCRLCRLLMLMQCQNFHCVLCGWDLEAVARFGLFVWGQHAGVPLFGSTEKCTAPSTSVAVWMLV